MRNITTPSLSHSLSLFRLLSTRSSCTQHSRVASACVARLNLCWYSFRSVDCFGVCALFAGTHTLAIPFILLTTKANKTRVCVGRQYTLPLDEKQIWCALFQSVPSSSLASSHTVNGVFNERNEKKKRKKNLFFRLSVANSTRKIISGFYLLLCRASWWTCLYRVRSAKAKHFQFSFQPIRIRYCPSVSRKTNTKK